MDSNDTAGPPVSEDQITAGTPLSEDQILVYVGGQDSGDGYADERPAGIRDLFSRHGLETVTIDDAELDRLRGQVSRIAAKLESPGQGQRDGFGIDSITLHIGISASGHFFLVASASMEAAIDVTWSRHH